MASRKEETALGVARARFVEGLPRKAGELRGAVSLLAATPGDERAREGMRRSLHALYASAQVFRIERLAQALREAIQRLDGARNDARPLTPDDLDALGELARNLTTLAELPTGTAGVSSIAAPRRPTTSLLPPAPPRSSPPPPPPRPSRAPVRHLGASGAPPPGRPGMPASMEAQAGPSVPPPPPTPWPPPSTPPSAGGGSSGSEAPVAAGGESGPASWSSAGASSAGAPRPSQPFESLIPARAEAGNGREPSRDADVGGRGRTGTMRFPAFDPSGGGQPRVGAAPTPAPPPPASSARPADPEPSASPLAAPGAPKEPTVAANGAPSAVGMGPASATPGGRRLVGEDDGDEEVTAETIVSPPPEPSTPPPPAAEPASSRAPSGSFTAARNTGRFPVPAPAADRPMGSTGPAVAHVLVVGPPALRDQVARALPEDGYEVVGDSDPENALRLARSSAPDAVVASASVVLDDDLAFVSRLRSDPLTDFVPVVAAVPGAAAADDEALARAGADALIAEPVAADALTAQLDRVTQGLTSPGSIPALGEATPREIAHRLSQEIERGLVDALEVGGSVKVPVGDGSEVLAAAWAAISRVRAHVARRSEGAVRYRDTAARGGPALLALLDDDADSGQPADEVGADPYVPPGVDPRLVDEVDLRGRRVLVADDDPSVLDFFAGLLEDAGCSVVRARDGQEALDAARRARPDVVLSDILMPRVDGLGVCREVRRDPALADVPVILISWKEDFLQRMRELQAGASGYLRKEASGARILAKVRQVLRPRARLETQLRAGSEVRGRLEGIGIVPLLRTVAGEWVDARVVVRDAFHLFEVDLRGGELADATRTAVDGNFARGARVLPQLLGSTAGRFTATKGRGSHRPTVAGSLDGTLRRAMTQLTSVVDAVSGTALPQAAQVRFDEDVVAALLQASPERTRQLVEWLDGDKGPRDLLMEGLVAPQVLESDLVDLARRGAIAEVQGPLGEDRIEAARVARERAAELAPTADRSLAGQHPAPLLASPGGAASAGSERPSASGPASEPVDDQASTSAFSAEAVAAAEAESAPASVIPPRDAHPPAAAPLFSTPAHIPPAAPDTPEPFADPDGLSLRDDPTERSDVEDPPGPVVGEPAGEARDTIEELPGQLSGSAAGASRPASGADAPERPRLLDAVDDEPTRVRPSWPGEKPAGSGPSELDPSLLVDESDGDEATPLARPTPEPSVIVADEDGLPPAVDPSAEVPTVHRRADPTQTVGEWSPMAPPSRVGASTPSVPPAAPGVGERPDASGLVATPGGPPSTASQSGLHRPITEDVDDDAPAVRSSGTRTVPEATPEPPVDAAAATIAAGGDASAEAVPSAPRTDPTPGTMEVTGREAAQDGLPTESRSWIGYALLFATLFGVGFGAMTYSYPWVGPAVEPYVEWAVRPFVELFTGGGGGDRPLGDAPPPASEPATGGEGGEAPGGNAAGAGETAPAGPPTGGGADGQPAPAAPTGGAPDAPGAEETSDGDGSPETPTGEPGEPEASSTTTTTTASAPLDLGEQLAWGERQRQVTEAYPGEVGAEEGLLVIEAAGEPGSEGADEGAAASTGPLVRIADRRFGRPPARLALPEGRYEVVFEHGEDEVSYRWVHLAAGETRFVRAP